MTQMACAGMPAISTPSNLMEPEVLSNAPASILKMVLLPDPLGPISPRISPLSTAKSTLSTAVNPPNRLVKFLTSSILLLTYSYSLTL